MSASENDPERKPNIILTGFMGTGKTTVGRILARGILAQFVDTDWMIEQRHGPIHEIFAKQGESSFRRIESDLAQELAKLSGVVISTGGRFLLDPANATALLSTGRVFCLVATPDEVLQRVGSGASRPLLDTDDPHQRVLELLAERAPQYAQFPQVSTSGRTPTEVAEEIARQLGQPIT